MTKTDAKAQWQKLATEIRHHDKLYYQRDEPEISDAQYDVLRRELEALEKEFPELQTPDSPTQKVGAAPLSTFDKIRHTVPMLSLGNAMNEEEVADFFDRARRFLGLAENEKIETVTELKIDGLSFSARYENGKFVQGVTRGDGEVGENITDNLATILPLTLKNHPPAVFEVRGEIYMTHDAFKALNEQRQAEDEPLFVNPRNAAAGSLRQLDAEITRARKLQYFVYSWAEISEPLGQLQSDYMKAFKKFGLNTIESFLEASSVNTVKYSLEEIMDFYREMEKRRPDLSFDIDGLVYKINRLDWQKD